MKRSSCSRLHLSEKWVRAGTMACWGLGLSVTPTHLVTNRKGLSLDRVFVAETSGFPDFHQHFFPFTSHFYFQRRGSQMWEQAGRAQAGQKGDNCIIVPFIHKTLRLTGWSAASKMTNTAYRCFDVMIFFFLMHMLPCKLEERLEKCTWHLE